MHSWLRTASFVAVLVVALCQTTAWAKTSFLRVQVVLTAKSSRLVIAPAVADKVAAHITGLVPNIVSRTHLVSSERIVLNFESAPEQRADIERAINGLEHTNFGSLLTVQDKKFEIVHGVSPLPTSEPVEPAEVRTARRFEIDLESAGNAKLLKISARDIALREILSAMAQLVDFSYVCAATAGTMRLSIEVRGVHIEELLTALKGALGLSVRKVGSLYVISANTRGSQEGQSCPSSSSRP